MNKLEVKALCNKDPKDVTMVEYQNLKSSMLDQLGGIDGTCVGIWCTDCCLNNKGDCSTLEIKNPQKAIELVQEWHKENTLKIDWSKVPVDTPIWVWEDGYEGRKVKRHFAKFENGEIYVWTNGVTSWTVEKDKHVSKWGNAELVEDLEYKGEYVDCLSLHWNRLFKKEKDLIKYLQKK